MVRAAAELEQGSAIGAVQGAAGHAQCPSGQGGRRWCPREQKPNGHGPRRRRHSHWYGLREVPSLNPMDSCEENIKQEAHSRYSVPFRAAAAGTQVSDSGSHRQAQGTDSQGSLVRASLGPAPLVIVKAEAWQTLLLPRVRPQATDRASGRPPAQAVCAPYPCGCGNGPSAASGSPRPPQGHPAAHRPPPPVELPLCFRHRGWPISQRQRCLDNFRLHLIQPILCVITGWTALAWCVVEPEVGCIFTSFCSFHSGFFK